MHLTRNQTSSQGDRGFESLTLRHIFRKPVYFDVNVLNERVTAVAFLAYGAIAARESLECLNARKNLTLSEAIIFVCWSRYL